MQKFDNASEEQQHYTQLLHAISHDMRAPLRHIRSFYHLMLSEHESDWTEEQLECQGFIAQALDTAETQFQRLLVLSRLHTRSHEHKHIDIKSTIEDVIEIVEQEVNNTLVVELKGEISRSINVKADLFQRACYEIIMNAFQYAAIEESSKLSISVAFDDENVSLGFQDNGPGIKENLLEECFKPLRRLVEDKAIKGAGLGLCIAKQAVQLMHGTLSASVENGFALMIKLPNAREK